MKKLEELRKLKNPPEFEPEKWGIAIRTGCYNYAINVLAEKFYLIGDFIDNRCTENTSDEELVATLKRELKEVFHYQVEETSRESKIGKKQFKICMVRDIHTGYYHLYRLDRDGIWSDKIPNDIPLKSDEYDIFGSEGQEDKPFSNLWIFLLTDLEEVIE